MSIDLSKIKISPKLLAIIIGVALVVLVAFPALTTMLVGNHAISLEATCEREQGDINAQLTRRARLIPDLIATVKAASSYEHDTQLDVIAQRVANDKTGEYQAGIEIAAVAEDYPELKVNTDYLQLMTELSVTENLIFQHRSIYNGAAKDYDVYTRQQPWKLFLSISGYQVKTFPYTEAPNEEYVAPGALFD